jgi:microcompartment protein CcmK/EutM
LVRVEFDGGSVIAADTMNAHVDQHVLVLTGCAARHLSVSAGRCWDAVVVAIVDDRPG